MLYLKPCFKTRQYLVGMYLLFNLSRAAILKNGGKEVGLHSSVFFYDVCNATRICRRQRMRLVWLKKDELHEMALQNTEEINGLL